MAVVITAAQALAGPIFASYIAQVSESKGVEAPIKVTSLWTLTLCLTLPSVVFVAISLAVPEIPSVSVKKEGKKGHQKPAKEESQSNRQPESRPEGASVVDSLAIKSSARSNLSRALCLTIVVDPACVGHTFPPGIA